MRQLRPPHRGRIFVIDISEHVTMLLEIAGVGDVAPPIEEIAMARILIFVFCASVILMAARPNRGLAQAKKVDVGKTWAGSVDDTKAKQPECITTAKGLENIWKAWQIAGDVPKVDFTKDMVVAVYSPGSSLSIAIARLDDKGNLEVVGLGTRDFRPGFRYVLGVVSKEGVKTVNKKELPKE